MWAILPIKEFRNAKSRLKSAVAPEQRSALARAMVSDVLDTLSAVSALDGTLVVSDEPEVADFCSINKVQLISAPDWPNRSHSQAVVSATRYLAGKLVTEALVLPGDAPLVTAPDIEIMIATYRAISGSPKALFCSDREGRGTNAILLSLPAKLTFSYGPDSLERHMEDAQANGLATEKIALPNFALDIDTPDDLAELRKRLHEVPISLASKTRSVLKTLDTGAGTAASDRMDVQPC